MTWTEKRAEQQRARRAQQHASRYGTGAGDQRGKHAGIAANRERAVAARKAAALDHRAKLLSRCSVGQDGCWNWTGAIDRAGYGMTTRAGRGTTVRAHRLAYETFVGPIDDGLFVCHRCDNRRCFNPEHLFLGTARDNTHDMIEKGRSRAFGGVVRKGTDHPQARLSPDDVREIRRLCESGERQRDVAKRFRVAQSLVGRIYRREAWQSIT